MNNKIGNIGEKKSSENQTTRIKCVKFGLEMSYISLADLHKLLVKFFNEKTMIKIEVFSENVSGADSDSVEENRSLKQKPDSGADKVEGWWNDETVHESLWFIIFYHKPKTLQGVKNFCSKIGGCELKLYKQQLKDFMKTSLKHGQVDGKSGKKNDENEKRNDKKKDKKSVVDFGEMLDNQMNLEEMPQKKRCIEAKKPLEMNFKQDGFTINVCIKRVN
jgi:hypothetical protein